MGAVLRRTIALLLMAITFIFLCLATWSTHWRIDHDDRYNVLITMGLWKICRDVEFGATIDHKCFVSFANDAPAWFQCVRAFMLISLLLTFISFLYSIYIITKLPFTRRDYPPQRVNMVYPGLIMVFAAGSAFIGLLVFAISTSMGQALYFPDGLTPTWADSWGDVWSQRNSLPLMSATTAGKGGGGMTMKYGYSFALACVCVFSTTASFITNCVASSGG